MSPANSNWTNLCSRQTQARLFSKAMIAACIIVLCMVVDGAQSEYPYHARRLDGKETSLDMTFNARIDASKNSGQRTDSHSIDKRAVVSSTVIPASLSQNIAHRVNAQTPLLYAFSFNEIDQNKAIRVEVSSTCATDDYPILISTRQREDILAWTLPFNDYKAGKRVLRPKQKSCQHRGYYTSVGRTLCPEHIVNRWRINYNNNNNNTRDVSVEISTKSQSNWNYNLLVSVVDDFELKHNETATIQVAAAQPKYYMYTFPDGVDDLVIRVRSNSSTCMTAAVQKLKCPVLDLERNIEFDAKFQTMSRQSTLTLERKDYKRNGTAAGFFLVFVVHSTDEECTDEVSSGTAGDDRFKVVTVEFSEGLSSSKYAAGIALPVVVFLVLYATIVLFEIECITNACCYNEDGEGGNHLIVLGLPSKSTEDDLTKHFSQFGKLVLVQVKRHPTTGRSKGFGFIRFNSFDAQNKCCAQRHNIDGSLCDVIIPNSKEGCDQMMSRKVLIGGVSEDLTVEDLREYFSNYGEVVGVFIPKPHRAFAFVTFSDAEVAQSLCGEDHIVKNTSVHVSNASPKTSYDREGCNQMMSRKVLIGRVSEDLAVEDLHAYFSKYGKDVNVFVPNPQRAFAFVTFSDAKVAQSLCGDHIVKNASVHVSNASPETSYDRVSTLSANPPGNHYCWNLVSMSLFYCLPAIQLVATYLKVLEDSGDEDLCYYNYACANPAGSITSFNNVFSNIGYVLLGILFIIIVWRRKCVHAKKEMDKTGIHHDYGMFGALGFALVMEGVMSGTYHICPNSFNFQFDTSFMYLMASVAIMKLYQNRHSDIVPTATKTYLCVGGYILLSVLLMLFHSTFLWVVFVFYHGFCTLVFLIQYLGYGKWSVCCSRDKDIKSVFFPPNWRNIYSDIKEWFDEYTHILVSYGFPILVGLGNAGVALWFAIAQPDRVATYFLYTFVSNLGAYFLFYIFRKSKWQCCPCNPVVMVMMIVVLGVWAYSLYCFSQHASEWAETPAVSRATNKGCISALFDFYDIHDLWHFLSAISLFLSFVVMLIIDDDVSKVKRDDLDIF